MASTVASTSRASLTPDKERKMPKVERSSSKERRHRQSASDTQESYRRNSSTDRSQRSRIEGEAGEEETHDITKDDWKRKKIAGPKESAFRYLYPIIDIPIPPALMHDPHRAAEELIDTLLMRYVPQMSGVLLSHRNIHFLRPQARIDSDGAYAIAPAGLTCLVWAPDVGMRLEGKLQLSTPSHISLLVHGIFNASITSAHLPSREQAHSSKDPEYQWHEFDTVDDDIKMSDADGDETNGLDAWPEQKEKSTGYWENKTTGERLGGKDGKIVFTVVGMTVANHMLSLFGSLLRKPFSVAAPTFVPSFTPTVSASTENARRVHFTEERQERTFGAYNEEEEEEGEGPSDNEDLPSSNQVSAPEEIKETRVPKKKRSKIGPRREGELSGSESESEARREKKKRKKA